MAQAAKIQALFQLMPAFKSDRDENWFQHLTSPEANHLRKQRNEYHYLVDEMDRCRLEMKAYPVGSENHTELKLKQAELRRERDTVINDLLRKIPLLKTKALRAQKTKENGEEVEMVGSKRAFDDYVSEVGAEMTDFLSGFLPTHLAPAKPKPKPPVRQVEPIANKPVTATRPSELRQELPAKPTRDTYLDGVSEQNHNILLELRPLVEKLDSREKVLTALECIRRRDLYLDAFEKIKHLSARHSNSQIVALSQ